MFYQTEDYFNPRIKKWGCNFFSCLKISELEAQDLYEVSFRKQDVENIYYFCKEHGYITRECVVQDPDSVIDAGYRYLTSRHIIAHQVGAIEGDDVIWWRWVENNKKYQKYKYMIYRWKTFKGGEHFNLYDADGNKLYDSWEEDVENELRQKLLYYIGSK